MWQTEINIFLQSFSSHCLTGFLKFITTIGGEASAIFISIVVMFGVSFRTGFILFQVCTFSKCLNDALKTVFALPRPETVDANVQLLWKNKPNKTPLTSAAAKKFFSMLPQETIDYFRTHNLGTYGFPSGTSTRAVSFWGMIFMLYKKTCVRIIAVMFILLIPVARIYFGKHFLADVLGSFVVSFMIIGIFYGFIYRNKKLMRFLFDEKGYPADGRVILLVIAILIIPFVLLMVSELAGPAMGPLLGINTGYMLLRFQGLPKDTAKIKDRLARIMVAGICYLFFVVGLEKFIKEFTRIETELILSALKAMGMFLFIWSAMKISIWFGFFKDRNC